jgi:outer membrane protein assembly factor BamB
MKAASFNLPTSRDLLLLAVLVLSACPAPAANWPEWRGPGGVGISSEKEAPLKWSATENVRWKIPLPDRGNSTPIVWGSRIFLTQPLEKEHRRTLLCVDRGTGNILWQQGPVYAEKEKSHPTNPPGSASPVTDGECVIAAFGSAGVYCYDLNGKELWHRDLGKISHEWGYASSPVIHGDLCIVYHGPSEKSALIALDKKTGATKWELAEPMNQPIKRTDGFAGNEAKGIVGTFSTPIIVRAGGRDELVMSYPERVEAFDPKTGKSLWRCGGLNPLIYSSPIFGEGVVVAMGGFLGSSVAVKAGGQGDVTDTHRLWQVERTKNRLGSGVIHQGHVYILNTPGVAECIDLKTGKVIWEERVPSAGPKSESWSSMTLAGDKIYILNQSGDTVVLRAAPKFEVLGLNAIGNELTNASTVVADGEILIRTHKHLWCIGSPKAVKTARN